MIELFLEHPKKLRLACENHEEGLEVNEDFALKCLKTIASRYKTKMGPSKMFIFFDRHYAYWMRYFDDDRFFYNADKVKYKSVELYAKVPLSLELNYDEELVMKFGDFIRLFNFKRSLIPNTLEEYCGMYAKVVGNKIYFFGNHDAIIVDFGSNNNRFYFTPRDEIYSRNGYRVFVNNSYRYFDIHTTVMCEVVNLIEKQGINRSTFYSVRIGDMEYWVSLNHFLKTITFQYVAKFGTLKRYLRNGYLPERMVNKMYHDLIKRYPQATMYTDDIFGIDSFKDYDTNFISVWDRDKAIKFIEKELR